MIEKDISEIIKGQDKVDLYIAIISALSKQIPHKLAPKTSKSYEVPVCGKCGGIMDLQQGNLNYCPNCGQKINWEG